MVKVMATGTFDLLHMGHIYFLKEAKKQGDTLCVVVATDATVRRLKHEPVNPEEIRLNLIKELTIVDEAYLGYENDMYTIVKDEIRIVSVLLEWLDHKNYEKRFRYKKQ